MINQNYLVGKDIPNLLNLHTKRVSRGSLPVQIKLENVTTFQVSFLSILFQCSFTAHQGKGDKINTAQFHMSERLFIVPVHYKIEYLKNVKLPR